MTEYVVRRFNQRFPIDQYETDHNFMPLEKYLEVLSRNPTYLNSMYEYCGLSDQIHHDV